MLQKYYIKNEQKNKQQKVSKLKVLSIYNDLYQLYISEPYEYMV